MDYNKINKIDTDGNGNIILQDINGTNITINYNDLDKIKNTIGESNRQLLQEIEKKFEIFSKKIEFKNYNNYINKIEKLIQAGNQDGNLATYINNNFLQNDKINYQEVSKVYLDRLFEEINIVQIFNMKSSKKLDDVYIEPDIFFNSENTNAFNAINSTNRLIIEGASGSGKSTILSKYIIDCFNGIIDYIPIYIKLVELTYRNENLFDRIEKTFDFLLKKNSFAFLDNNAMQGHFIFLLDGFDEIPNNQKERNILLLDIEKLARTYPSCKFVITTRPNIKHPKGFQVANLVNFNYEKSKNFIEKWFNNCNIDIDVITKKLHVFSEESLGFESDEKDYFDFVARISISKLTEFELFNPATFDYNNINITPLILTYFCLINFDENKQYANKAELYDQIIKLYVDAWNKDREIEDYLGVDIPNYIIEQSLFCIAYQTFKNNSTLFRKEDIVSILAEFFESKNYRNLNFEKYLTHLTVNIGLLRQDNNLYSFIHKSILEFLASKYITTENLHRNTQYINHHSWNNIFEFLIHRTDIAQPFINVIIDKIRELIYVDKTVKQLFTDALEFSRTFQTTNGNRSVISFMYIYSHTDCFVSIQENIRWIVKRLTALEGEINIFQFADIWLLNRVQILNYIKDKMGFTDIDAKIASYNVKYEFNFTQHQILSNIIYYANKSLYFLFTGNVKLDKIYIEIVTNNINSVEEVPLDNFFSSFEIVSYAQKTPLTIEEILHLFNIANNHERVSLLSIAEMSRFLYNVSDWILRFELIEKAKHKIENKEFAGDNFEEDVPSENVDELIMNVYKSEAVLCFEYFHHLSEQKNKKEVAIGYLEKANSIFESIKDKLDHTAKTYFACTKKYMKDYPTSIQLYEECIDEYPNYFAGLINLAGMYFKEYKNIEKAKKYWDMAKSNMPKEFKNETNGRSIYYYFSENWISYISNKFRRLKITSQTDLK